MAGFSINFTNVAPLVKLLKGFKGKLEQDVGNNVQQMGLRYQALVMKATPVDTSRLRASITTESQGMQTVVGTNVEYACVVGAQHQVYNLENRTSANIGNYPFKDIISKDGLSHKIKRRYRFSSNPIDCVAIKTRQGRNPLVVTAQHLILILRDAHVIWEHAESLKLSDTVFGKRSHNAITDNSNKQPYLCFCGKVFWVGLADLKYRNAKYCSLECRHKYGPHNMSEGKSWQLAESQKRYGENNPQWRDGACLSPYANFNGQLKAQVKERDGYQCQSCGSPFDLVVHHIDWNKMNPDIDNLITLCRRCHGRLNRQDCELPEVNVAVFTPKTILEINHYTLQRNGKQRLPYLYDFTVEDENSFVVDGLLIHNSFVEYGTDKMEARHVEGTNTRILGTGPFAYAMEQFKAGVKNGAKEIAKDVENRFSMQKLRGFKMPKFF